MALLLTTLLEAAQVPQLCICHMQGCGGQAPAADLLKIPSLCLLPHPNPSCSPSPDPTSLLQVPVEQQEVQATLRPASDETSDVMRKSMLKRQTFQNFERVKNREVNVVEGECY